MAHSLCTSESAAYEADSLTLRSWNTGTFKHVKGDTEAGGPQPEDMARWEGSRCGSHPQPATWDGTHKMRLGKWTQMKAAPPPHTLYTSHTLNPHFQFCEDKRQEQMVLKAFISYSFMCVGCSCCACISVYHVCAQYLLRSEEDVASPGGGVTDGCESQCGFWEPNLAPL